jgi:hypothetical protein
VGKPEGKKTTKKTKTKVGGNIKMDLRKIGLGWYGLD